MTRTTFEQEMHTHLRRQPFKPFVIEFDNGECWVVEHRKAISYWTGDSALYFPPDGSFNFVDCDNVVRLVEVPDKASA